MLNALLALHTGLTMVILVGSPCDTAMGPSQAATTKSVQRIEASATPCPDQHARKVAEPAPAKKEAKGGVRSDGTRERDHCVGQKANLGQSGESAHQESQP
jgi:hypothetical protein